MIHQEASEDTQSMMYEKTRLLFERHRISLPGILVLTFLLTICFRHANPVALTVWLLVVGGCSASHWYCIRKYFQQPSRFDGYSWARLLTSTSGLLAFALGLGAFFFIDLQQGINVVVITLFVVSPIFGSAVFAAPYFPIHVAWSLASTLPLIWRLIFSGMTDFVLLGGAMLVVGVSSALVLGWILSRDMDRALRIRFENMRLIKALSLEKERVENVSREKSHFLASVSHDLRQPLHALELFHSSLKTKIEDKDSQQLLAMAVQSSHALSEMLGELMDIARLDAGKIIASKKVIPLATMLGDCIEEQSPSAKEKGLSLRYIPPIKGCVDTDPVLFKRILRNLISNAIRHTKSGGLLVSARLRGKSMLIEVYDTGSGISDTNLHQIFNEFYQVGNHERDREKGLGLGLAIVHRIAAMLGYEVRVKSRLGHGSCFSLTVPLCEIDECCDEQAVDTMVECNDFTGVFVIVVDDDKMILQGMRTLLRGWGCEILLAGGEDELMAKLSAHNYMKPDLVISDYRLRGERTGLDIVKYVRMHFDSDMILAAIISGDVYPEVQASVIAAGYQWLEKPVSEVEIKQLLSLVVGKEL